jgi:hypothetical protein
MRFLAMSVDHKFHIPSWEGNELAAVKPACGAKYADDLLPWYLRTVTHSDVCLNCVTASRDLKIPWGERLEFEALQNPSERRETPIPETFGFLQFDGELTYLVGWIGWGSVEEDLYQINAASAEDAIDGFLAACRDGMFDGHGAHNLAERSIWPDTDEHILVYAMAELGQYRRVPQWEKVG